MIWYIIFGFVLFIGLLFLLKKKKKNGDQLNIFNIYTSIKYYQSLIATQKTKIINEECPDEACKSYRELKETKLALLKEIELYNSKVNKLNNQKQLKKHDLPKRIVLNNETLIQYF